jgi:chorismate mutase
MDDDKLLPLRNQIDSIDTQILELLNQRAKVAQEVGHIKAQTRAPIFRPEREAQVRWKNASRSPFWGRSAPFPNRQCISNLAVRSINCRVLRLMKCFV